MSLSSVIIDFYFFWDGFANMYVRSQSFFHIWPWLNEKIIFPGISLTYLIADYYTIHVNNATIRIFLHWMNIQDTILCKSRL